MRAVSSLLPEDQAVEGTMKALGASPRCSSGIPMTATSCTSGCDSRCPSSSAGGTWYPEDLINLEIEERVSTLINERKREKGTL